MKYRHIILNAVQRTEIPPLICLLLIKCNQTYIACKMHLTKAGCRQSDNNAVEWVFEQEIFLHEKNAFNPLVPSTAWWRVFDYEPRFQEF